MHDNRNDRRPFQNQHRPHGAQQQPRRRGLTIRRQRHMIDLAPIQAWLGLHLARLTWSTVAAGLVVVCAPLHLPAAAVAGLALAGYGGLTALSMAYRM